jgi:hypothetical protein
METFREDYFQFLPFETIEEIFLLLDPILASWPILARVCFAFFRLISYIIAAESLLAYTCLAGVGFQGVLSSLWYQ